MEPKAERKTAVCYLPIPDPRDVLREQLAYLIEHLGHNVPTCVGCVRLAQVKRLLMQPFE
jgi:hypothetical protein